MIQGSFDGVIKIWDVANLKHVATAEVGLGVRGLSFCPHGDNLWLFSLAGKLGPAPAPGSGQGVGHAGEKPTTSTTSSAGSPTAGKTIFAPRLAAGLLLTVGIAAVNRRGIRLSGLVQDVLTFGLLALFAIFTALGFARGHASNLPPLFAQPGTAGALLSVLFVLQVVPYFLTGFESIGKESEEARPDFDPRHFGRAITASLIGDTSPRMRLLMIASAVDSSTSSRSKASSTLVPQTNTPSFSNSAIGRSDETCSLKAALLRNCTPW